MKLSRWFLLCVAGVLGASAASQSQTQVAVEESRSTPGGDDARKPERKKSRKELAAEQEQRRRAMQMLESAAAQAAGFEGAERAFAQWQLAQVYGKSDKARAVELLRSAFQATATIEGEDLEQVRDRLQEQVLRDLVRLDVAAAQELAQQAGEMPKQRTMEHVVGHYTRNKQYDEAIQALVQASADSEFLYAAALPLMSALPPERDGEKQSLFAQAVTSFKQSRMRPSFRRGGDLGDMVVRFWKEMPRELVLEATDELLKKAQQFDQGDLRMRVGMTSSKGKASLHSMYEYRLFQVLPAIRAYDAGRAERLLQENRQMAALLGQYPEGVHSLDAGQTPGASDGMQQSVSIGPKQDGAMQRSNTEDEAREQFEMRAARIVADADKNPRQAVAAAASLPDAAALKMRTSPRARALAGIADATWKTNPSAAREALAALRRSLDGLEPLDQSRFLLRAFDLYLRLEDGDSAKGAIEEGVKLAEKAYEIDTHKEKPNLAPKSLWPSTLIWREFLQAAQKAAPAMVPEIIAGIKDEQIRVLQQISYAASLLEAQLPPSVAMRVGKGSVWINTLREDARPR